MTPEALGLAFVDVLLPMPDGHAVHGWYLPPYPRSGGPLAGLDLTLLCCHGNAGDISLRLAKADIFHRLGLSVLLFDYRGYGESSGRPTEPGTYQDADEACRYLVEEQGISAERLVIYGESLGGAVATETALRRPCRALILDSAFTSVSEMARAFFPRLPLRWALSARYDTLSKIPRLNCPVLVLHSQQDDIVPFEMGMRLFAAAPEPKSFFEMRGDHNDGYRETGPAYGEAIGRFLSSACNSGK